MMMRWLAALLILFLAAPVGAQQNLGPQGRPTFDALTLTPGTTAGLPSVGSPGRLKVLKDGVGGLVMDTGIAWSRQSRYVMAANFDFSGVTSSTAITTTGQRDPYFFPAVLTDTVAGADPGRIYYIRLTCTADNATETLPSALVVRQVAANSQLVIAPPPQAFIPDSTDTAAETITRAAGINYTAGTAVTVSATGGGLTTNILYYVGNLSAGTTFSLYDTHANALVGGATGKVNLTASITATLDGWGCSSGATGYFVYAGTAANSLTRQNAGAAVAIGSSFTMSAYGTGGAALPTANGTGSTTLTVGAANIHHFFAPVDGVYQVVLIDTGTAQEPVVVAAVGATTITVAATKTHTAGFAIASATGGAGEATMAFPTTGDGSGKPIGGQVVFKAGITTTSVPIQTRYGIGYVGAGGNRVQGNFTNGYGSQVQLVIRSPAYAVFLCTGSLAGQQCSSNTFRELTVMGFGSDGIRFTYFGDLLTIQQSDIGTADTTNTQLSAVRLLDGIARMHVTESTLRGGFPIKAVGFVNEMYVTRSTFWACTAGCEHIWIDVSGNGYAGGYLNVRDSIFEDGDRAIVYARNLATVILDGANAADQVLSAGQNFVTIVNDLTQMNEVIIRNSSINGGVNAVLSLTGGAASYILPVLMEDNFFVVSGPGVPLVKIESGLVAGPFYAIRNRGIGRPESTDYGISGTFLAGYQYIGNDNGLVAATAIPDLDARPYTGAMTYAGFKALTEGAATSVIDVGLGVNTGAGITLEYTIHARDAAVPSEWQARRGTVQVAGVEQSDGTVACTVGAATETIHATSGTLTVTWTCVTGTHKVTLKADATSSLGQTVLQANYRLRTDGTATSLWQQ